MDPSSYLRSRLSSLSRFSYLWMLSTRPNSFAIIYKQYGTVSLYLFNIRKNTSQIIPPAQCLRSQPSEQRSLVVWGFQLGTVVLLKFLEVEAAVLDGAGACFYLGGNPLFICDLLVCEIVGLDPIQFLFNELQKLLLMTFLFLLMNNQLLFNRITESLGDDWKFNQFAAPAFLCSFVRQIKLIGLFGSSDDLFGRQRVMPDVQYFLGSLLPLDGTFMIGPLEQIVRVLAKFPQFLLRLILLTHNGLLASSRIEQIMQMPMRCSSYDNPALKINILDYTYTSEPSINTCLPLKTSHIKLLLFYIGVVLSCGFVWLLTKWSARKKAIFQATVCSLEQATHLLIHDQDTGGEETLVERLTKFQIRLRRECPAFVYHHRTYIYIQQKQVFVPIRYEQLGLHLDKLKRDKFCPYSEAERDQLLSYYGANVLRLPVQTRLDIFVQQMLTPYQVFQTYGIILWIIEEYYIFAFVLLGYSLYVYWKNSSEIVRSQENLSFESYFDVECKVLIDEGQTQEGADMKEEVQLCNLDVKVDEHRSDIIKGHFNGVQQLEVDVEMPVVRKGERGKVREVGNGENVLINSKNVRFNKISSHRLIPGDIFILNEGDIVACDCILLRGEALVDEKYTSGESYLVRKGEVRNFTYIKQNQKSFLIYLGTEIIKIKNNECKKRCENKLEPIDSSMQADGANEIVCMVTQTNFNTLRGKFLRAIRYQSKQESSFFRQTIYFVYIIMALTTVVYIIIFAIIGQYRSKLSMAVYYLDLLVTAIPPTLPAVLNVGIDFVQLRLKNCGINCVLPKSTLTGGKVDTIILQGNHVFGKEYAIHSAAIGTKGERGFGLTFYTVNQFESYNDSQPISYIDLEDLRKKRKERDGFYKIGSLFINALASCHTLQFFRKSVQGSIFQKKVFEFSQSSNLSQDQFSTLSHEISVLKIVRFKQKSKKMGVIVKLKEKRQGVQGNKANWKGKGQRMMWNEGDLIEYGANSETMKAKPKEYQSDQDEKQIDQRQSKYGNERKMIFIKGTPEKILPMCSKNSYPLNSFQYIVDMAEKGFILCCYAMKQLSIEASEDVDYHYINHSQFTFLGFIILQQFKSQENIDAINCLKHAALKLIFISEERELDTTSKAIFNQLCTKNQLLLCNITKNKDKIYCKGHIQWQSSAQNIIPEFLTEFQDFAQNSKVSLSSSLYEELFMKEDIEAAQAIFDRTIIYNKMDLKFEKNLYGQLEKRKRVSLAVGGGVNVSECANLSLQLGRESSGLLSSLYTSSNSLKSVVNCLRICRAGLSTNFHCFSMMILFSLIQVTTVAILNCNYQGLTNGQMLYEDLFITFPIFVTINLTLPASKLSKELPANSFFSLRNISSMGGQLVIQFVTQLGFILYVLSIDSFKAVKESAFHNYVNNSGQFLIKSQISLALFVLSNNLYLGIVLSTSVSKPFRKPFYTNPYYTANLIALWCYNTFIVVFPNISPENIRMRHLSQQSEFVLVLALLVGNLAMLLMYLYENLLAFLWSKDNCCVKKDGVGEGSMNQENK